ncbi:VOC family protein [Puniceibacterium sp. IMCC21224]|uniref:VOC family protein n=1 Tax=Puniceibacterium sp. IMCC21224 TaxID=1618204 RepID=UPI00065D2D6C|nr:VOC family protein [Puniceibacterium sp. IMCC21224]KMK67231.1 lactoylglutathione lyase family protein [Puniceibacterium sp. IMCC21224]
MSLALGRLIIYTGQIDRMVDFYARHFGFSIVHAASDRIVELRPQNTGITILLHPAAKGQRVGQAIVKLVFDVEDVEAFCEAVRKDGLAFGKIHKADGYVFANAKDPDKNSIQVSSRAFAT